MRVKTGAICGAYRLTVGSQVDPWVHTEGAMFTWLLLPSGRSVIRPVMKETVQLLGTSSLSYSLLLTAEPGKQVPCSFNLRFQ